MSDLQQDSLQKFNKAGMKIISYAMQATEMSAEMIKGWFEKVSKIDVGKDKYSTTTIGKMLKSGKNITMMDEGMLPDVAKRFYKFAKTQNIPFSMLKDNSTAPPTYHLCINENQQGIFKNCMKNFLAEESKRLHKPSLRKKLQVKIKEAKQINLERKVAREENDMQTVYAFMQRQKEKSERSR